MNHWEQDICWAYGTVGFLCSEVGDDLGLNTGLFLEITGMLLERTARSQWTGECRSLAPTQGLTPDMFAASPAVAFCAATALANVQREGRFSKKRPTSRVISRRNSCSTSVETKSEKAKTVKR